MKRGESPFFILLVMRILLFILSLFLSNAVNAQNNENAFRKDLFDRYLERAPADLVKEFELEVNRAAALMINEHLNFSFTKESIGLDAEVEQYFLQVIKQVLGDRISNPILRYRFDIKKPTITLVENVFIINLVKLHQIPHEGALAAAFARAYGEQEIDQHFTFSVFVQIGRINLDFPKQVDAKLLEWMHAADAKALDLMVEAGYGLSAQLEYLRLAHQFGSEFDLVVYPRDPDPTDVWLKMHQRKISEIGEHPQNQFLISEEAFYKIIPATMYLVLDYLNASGEYAKQLKLAFKFHVLFPDSPLIIEHILQANRLLSLQTFGLNSRKIIDEMEFLSSALNIANESKAVTKVRPHSSGILEEFRPVLLEIRPQQARQIKAVEYWREQPFKSNAQAFKFFTDALLQMGSREVYLELAHNTTDEQERNTFLQMYLSKEGIKHRDYAEGILAGKEKPRTEKKRCLLATNVILNLNGKHSVESLKVPNKLGESFWKDEALSAIFDSIYYCNPRNWEQSLILARFKNFYGFSRWYIYLKEKEDFKHPSMIVAIPEFWTLFANYNSSEVYYGDLSIGILTKARKDAEILKSHLNTPLDDLLQLKNAPITLKFTYLRVLAEANDWQRSSYTKAVNASKKLDPLEQLRKAVFSWELEN